MALLVYSRIVLGVTAFDLGHVLLYSLSENCSAWQGRSLLRPIEKLTIKFPFGVIDICMICTCEEGSND